MNYIASVKMSSKKRILVEGRDDKSHIKNLLNAIAKGHKVKVDTAENLKGDCARTAKNNRAKIEKVHDMTKQSSSHRNLYFLCDREFFKFEITDEISDLMSEDEVDGNLNWTIGHSLENYFIKEEIVCRAYRFLCGSEYKNDAEDLYEKIFSSALQVIATVTLAAKAIGKCSYPAGTIGWQDFNINGEVLTFDIEQWKSTKNNQIAEDFYNEYKINHPIVEKSNVLICSRICRGHTAMLLLQRTFSACLNEVSKTDDASLSIKLANDFSKIKESTLVSALCESWLQSVITGNAIYPEQLIHSVA
jgi:hypothetical protein